MIRIIDGKRYNTDTATKVADCRCRYESRSDFGWHDTSIYVTPKGAWFLAGEGGPMSMWAGPWGQNGSRGGSGVQPLTRLEALEELERVNATDAIEQYFASQIADA